MNKDHYVSLKVAQELAGAGIEFPESEMVWLRRETDRWKLKTRVHVNCLNQLATQEGRDQVVFIPAPSLMELLDRLPVNTEVIKLVNGFQVQLERSHLLFDSIPALIKRDHTAPDAAAKMLLKLEKEK